MLRIASKERLAVSLEIALYDGDSKFGVQRPRSAPEPATPMGCGSCCPHGPAGPGKLPGKDLHHHRKRARSARASRSDGRNGAEALFNEPANWYGGRKPGGAARKP